MKNIKSIYIFILLCLCTVNLIAGGKRDSLYIQIYGGINKSANENLPYTEFSKYPISGGAFVGIGEEITPLWGWRATFGLNHNKSRNVMKCESSDTWGWNDIELFGDATFDIMDAINRKASKSKFNLKAFVGIGGLWTFGFPKEEPLSYTYPYSKNSKLLFGFRAGLTATYKLSDRIRIGTELSHTMVQDQFNGVVDHKSPLDNRTNLSIGITWNIKSKKKHKLKAPIVYANRLKFAPELPMVIPEKEINKKRQLSGQAYLDFPVNETIIYPTYRNNPRELKKIEQSIDKVRFDNSVVITAINLHGYASPESPYSNNERLAKGRTEALLNYLKSEYSLNETKFRTQYTPEDWNNLRLFIADSVNTQKIKALSTYRNELLRVIDEDSDPDNKEEELKRVGNGIPYQWLYDHVYPALRHTDYTIEYTLKEYPVEEARKLIYTHPEALSLEEIYYVAASYPEKSDGYFDALIIAAKQYPNDDTANFNAACACIQRKKLKDAKIYIAKTGDTEDTQYLINVIKAMEGNVNWHFENNKLIIDDDNR